MKNDIIHSSSTFLAALRFTEGEGSGFPLLQTDQAPALLAAYMAPYQGQAHPFWHFDWELLTHGEVAFCSVALLMAGLLCSAGGIGGGGIYVTVLMMTGRLSPRDAVPLSKAIVFFGSLSSLALNLRRQFASSSALEAKSQKKVIIDMHICSLVVPAALVGTLLGVLLNRSASDVLIIGLLTSLLVAITVMVTWTAWCQYKEETNLMAAALDERVPKSPGRDDEKNKEEDGELTPLLDDSSAVAKGKLQRQESMLSVSMLLVVVVCGVARFHAGACWEDLQLTKVAPHKACHHPAVYFYAQTLERMMSSSSSGETVMALTLIVPLSICSMVMALNGALCIAQEKFSWQSVAKYEVMGVLTGCLAGLVGIGGGLIFSPFFLIMGVDPAVAVATSSTCVIFTSSSTTLQYLLTDRIIMSLTLVYGLVNLIASYLGTAFVHFLTDRFAGRRSYVTGIVAVGVALSALLSLAKLPGQ